MPSFNGINNDDPNVYRKQAAAIGARIDPGSGKWYDLKDGHYIPQDEADQRAQKAGVAIQGERGRPGFLNQFYDHNKAYIDPVLKVGSTALLGPVGGALANAGLTYSNTHDLGQSALSGATAYGGGKLFDAVSKLPGVSAVGDAIKNSAPGQFVSNIGDAIGDAGKSLVNGLPKLPGLSVPGGGAGGGGGFFSPGGMGQNLLGAGALANAAYLGQKSSNFADLAGKSVDEAYQAKAPLRTQGLAGLDANVPKVGLPGLSTIRSRGNPFAQGT